MYEHDMDLNKTMYKIFIQGIVQGVGFRPYIYRKAKEQHLVGTVRNTGNGVEIIINDKKFIQTLTDLPPLAKITQFTIKKIDSPQSFSDFSILKSSASQGETILPADIFMCQDCLHELRDTKNRRHDYYFITCTNCGPRFSMIEDYPYDRPLTSMKDFEMCPQCKSDYSDPLNRRYHAQTIACKDCGPKLQFLENDKNRSGLSDRETIQRAVRLIKSGKPVSIKGVGGFHTCSLCDDASVKKVRTMFNRPHKPYAIMVKDIDMAKKIAIVSKTEQEVLHSPQRPIVVLKKKNKNQYKRITELDSIGVMLPYTALHHLLFDFISEPLLMTSCNLPGEPVSTTEQIGNYFLTHERKIVNRCDDSVIKVIGKKMFFLRRSRGYTPLPVLVPLHCEDTIAVGAELNNVICTTKKDKCFLSQYIGDTSKYATLNFLKEAVNTHIKLTRLKPTLVTCDLHPGYNSTFFAKELADKYHATLVPIQHHKAHVASVAAEHHITDYVGIAMDGLGYGEDGTLWGGEAFLVKNKNKFTRIGHLEEQPQLGGDSATIYPKKMLFGILSKVLSKEEVRKLGMYSEKESRLYYQMLANNFNIQTTTSTGRILDAAAALLKLCDHRTYDGRSAMILESTATKPLECKPVELKKQGKTILLSTPLFEFILDNRKKNVGELAATAQTYIAEGFFNIAKKAAGHKLPIVFSGGVAYNRMICEYMLQHGVRVNKEIPAGDGGICYGQAYLANLNNNDA
jgi:hydrogenase maturation protein HypF